MRRLAPDLADAAMLLTAVIWAGNNVIVKDAVADIDPIAYVVARFALVVGLLFPILLTRRGSLRVPRQDWPLLLLSGIAGFAVYNILFTVALKSTSAFSAALLISMGPAFTLLMASAMGVEQVRRLQWVGIGLAIAGVGIFVGNKLRGEAPALGDGLTLLAAASFSIYSLASRRLTARSGAPAVTAWSALIGLMAILPFATSAVRKQDWISIGPAGWGAILYSSALSMLLAYSIWSWAIGQRGVGRTVPYLYLVPILTGIMAATFQGEQFGPLKLVGAGVTLVGLALTRHRAARLPAADLNRAVTEPAPARGRVGSAPARERPVRP